MNRWIKSHDAKLRNLFETKFENEMEPQATSPQPPAQDAEAHKLAKYLVQYPKEVIDAALSILGIRPMMWP